MGVSEQTMQAADEILAGIDLTKCQQCGCMRETLDQIQAALPNLATGEGEIFRSSLPGWLSKMKPVRYSCLGCEQCFASAAQNAFTGAFPQVADAFGLSCEIQASVSEWPPVAGEYVVVDPDAAIAVVTLASLDLPGKLAQGHPAGLSIAGKLETENIGIDKLIKNVIANPHLRYLIAAGIESAGHNSGQTLLALGENGIDSTGRVIGSTGKRPVLKNVTVDEVEAFRKQIKIVDLIGCEDIERIKSIILELDQQHIDQAILVEPCGCLEGT